MTARSTQKLTAGVWGLGRGLGEVRWSSGMRRTVANGAAPAAFAKVDAEAGASRREGLRGGGRGAAPRWASASERGRHGRRGLCPSIWIGGGRGTERDVGAESWEEWGGSGLGFVGGGGDMRGEMGRPG